MHYVFQEIKLVWVDFGSVLGQFLVSFGSVLGDVRLISGQLSTFWLTFDLFLG